MKFDVGSQIKQEINNFMANILSAAELMGPNENSFKAFRKVVLDGGNALIRGITERADEANLRVKVTRDELREFLNARRTKLEE